MEIKATVTLPDDLLADILGRLPARSLVPSRRVCKAWRSLIDDRRLLLRLRRLLPHSVRGLFINYQDHNKPHFFARPPVAVAEDGAPIKGAADFIVRELRDGYSYSCWHQVADHCNGLVLYQDTDQDVLYVLNPTTRRWARLPPCSGKAYGRRAFLVFDPAVSPVYKVLLAPRDQRENEVEEEDAFHMTEWPPSAWTWHEFSSRTGRWEEKVFVREGEAAGTVGDLVLDLDSSLGYSMVPRWRYAAYWKGELYVHCRGEFVARLSLVNDKYQVIKSPIDLTDCKNDVRSFLGRSKDGVYFAAIDDHAKIRVWMFTESYDQTGWVLKHQSNLKTNSWSLYEWNCDEQYDAHWIMDIANKKRYKEVSLQQDVCWNSDDDNIIDVSNDEEETFCSYVRFLGFHPYKEVVFLCDEGIAVACHLNSSKVQYLGPIHLGGIYNRGDRESFVYTPCLIGD